MTNELTRKGPELDGFAAFEDAVEGDEQRQSSPVIQGVLVRFTNEAEWELRDGEVIPPTLELVVVDIGRIVQKWCDQMPVETIILEPHQKFPDIQKLNDETPQSEWTEGPDGKKRGPWQKQHLAYLLDPKTMTKLT